MKWVTTSWTYRRVFDPEKFDLTGSGSIKIPGSETLISALLLSSGLSVMYPFDCCVKLKIDLLMEGISCGQS